MSKRWLVLNTYHCPYISWLCWAPHPWAPRGHLKVNVSVLLKFLRNSQACKFTPKAGNKVQLHNSMAWWIWEIKVRDRMPNHHNYNQIQLRWKEFGPVILIRQSLQTFFQRVSFEPLFVYIYAKNMNSCKKNRAKHNETRWKSLIQSWSVQGSRIQVAKNQTSHSFYSVCHLSPKVFSGTPKADLVSIVWPPAPSKVKRSRVMSAPKKSIYNTKEQFY